MAIDQLAGQGAVLEPEAVLGVAVANQHAKPGHRRGGRAGNAVVEGQVHHAAEQQKVQARADEAGADAGAVEQVHHRFGFRVIHPRQLGKQVLRRVGRAVAKQRPGLVAVGIFRIAANLDPENPQPAERRLQRQTAVRLANVHLHQQVGRQRLFGQPAGAAENGVAQLAGALQVPQRKLAARLFDIEHKVRHRPGVAQRSGGLDIAERRRIIPRALRASRGQQAQLAEHLALRGGLDAVQRGRDVVNGAEQQLVPRRLTRGVGQQAGGGQVNMASLMLIQQRKGGLLHPVMGEGILFFRQHDELGHHRRVQRIAHFRHRQANHAADHLHLARAAEAGDAAQQAARLVGKFFKLLQHQGDEVFGVVPGADRLQIVVPLVLIFVVHHQAVIHDAAEKLVHKERVAARLLVDQRGEVGRRRAAGAKYRRQPARHRFHGKRLRDNLARVLRRFRQARKQRLQGGVGHGADIPVGRDHQQRNSAAVHQQIFERVQAGGVAPLEIVEHQHQRAALRGKGFYQRQHHMAEARPGIYGKRIGREARLALKQQAQLGHEADGQRLVPLQGARQADFPLRHLVCGQPQQVQRQGAERGT